MMRMGTKLRFLAVASLSLVVYISVAQIQSRYHQSTLQSQRSDNPFDEKHEVIQENQKKGGEPKKPPIKSNGSQKVYQVNKDNEIGMEKWRRGFWASETEEETLFSINVTEVEEVMAERRRMVEKGCQEEETPEERSQPPNSKEFLISEKYRLIWCNIFKAASSTWLYNYLKMAGVSPIQLFRYRNSPVEAARNLYPRPSGDQLHRYMEDRNYSSFIVVREPFERLLSAYRDKIESKKQDYYIDLRCQILDFDNSQERMGGKQIRMGRKPVFTTNHTLDHSQENTGHLQTLGGVQAELKREDEDGQISTGRSLLSVTDLKTNDVDRNRYTYTRTAERQKSIGWNKSDFIGKQRNINQRSIGGERSNIMDKHVNTHTKQNVTESERSVIACSNSEICRKQKRIEKRRKLAASPHSDPQDLLPRKLLRRVPRSTKCRPSFRQFVEFILNEERLGRRHNEHWAPYHKFCSPCQVEFDYILHFETLLRDEAFLAAKMPGLEDIISQRLHSSHTNYTLEEARYFGQLDRALLLDLYHMYRQDFKIFGYSVDRYFDFVAS